MDSAIQRLNNWSQGVVNFGFRKLIRYNLNRKNLEYDMIQSL